MDYLKQSFFKKPLLKKKQITEVFTSMDSLVIKMIAIINDTSYYASERLTDYYVEIASGRAVHKNLFKEKNTKRKAMKMAGGIEKTDRRFLLQTYTLLHSNTTDIDIADFGFNRLVFNSIIEDFIEKTKDYIELSESKKYNLKKRALIEQTVRSKNNFLYGALKQIHMLYDKYVECRDKIMTSYFRFVYALSTRNSRSYEQTTENFQVGTIGLMRAILMYDVDSKSSFGNYVKHWIKQSIMKDIYDSFLIKIPTCTWSMFNKLEKNRPTTDSIKSLSDKSGVSENYITNIYNRVLLSQVPSLDAMMENGDTECLMYENSEDEPLSAMTKGLTKKEKFVIGVLFGEYDEISNEIPEKELELERLRQLT